MRTGHELTIGDRRGEAFVPGRVRTEGFGRHTFLCGQSGSGKTYALGVLLEQLHLETGLRIVVFDPNADFVGVDQVLPSVDPALRERWLERPVTVLGSDATGHEPMRLRFTSMPRSAQAALLQLDPLHDRGEYNHFLKFARASDPVPVDELVERLRGAGPDGTALAQRIENLGLPEWEVWAQEHRSAAEVVRAGSPLTVLDLNGFRDPLEPLAVCLDVIEDLWTRRQDRTPTLIVLDEAHNLCPAEPSGAIQSAVVRRLIQIAAEGRKYGLWLMLSTQRPSKLHPQVLSQCDNLVMMRMNSRSDLDELSDVFTFVPRTLIDASPRFVQGEALVAGRIAAEPLVMRMGSRITAEGGHDVQVPER